jgi:hypothetical protein
MSHSPEPPTERAKVPVQGGNARTRPKGTNTALIEQKQIEADLAKEQLKAELAREEIKDRDRARDDRRAQLRECFVGVTGLVQSLFTGVQGLFQSIFTGLQGLSHSCAAYLTWRNLGIVGIIALGITAIVYNRALIVGGLGLDVKVGEATTIETPSHQGTEPEDGDVAPAPDVAGDTDEDTDRDQGP